MDSIKNAVANILASPRKLVGATIVLIILLSVPITVVLVQQQQDIRQRAQTPSDTLTISLTEDPPKNGKVNENYLEQNVLGIWVFSAGETRYLGAGETSLSISSGSLPPGLILNDNVDFIDGIPTQAGTFFFRINACKVGTTVCGEKPASITIESSQPTTDIITVSLTRDPPPNGTVGQDYMGADVLGIWVFSGGENRYLQAGETAITIVPSNGLPPGLQFNNDVDFIDGTPIQAGNYSFTIKACRTNTTTCGTKQTSITITGAGGIDLENIGITPLQSTYCVGRKFTFEGKFKNNSSQDLNSVVVLWVREGVGEVGRDTFPNVGAGQTATSELVTDVANTSGSYTLTFIVDPDNAIPETNENNNKKSLSFNVQSTCPTTTLTKTPTQPPPPPPGQFCIPGIPGMCPAGQICVGVRCVAPSPTVTPTATLTPTPTPTMVIPSATTAPTNVPTGQPTATRVPTTIPTSTPPVATPTISPNEARVAIELLLPGIGSNTALGQNPNPVVLNHTAELQIFNSQNQKVKDVQGTVSFDPQTFSFKGNISLGPGLQAGLHTIKARLFNTLWKSLSIVNIDPGSTSRTNPAKLVSGDLDQNNELNLFDYNTMLSCYGAGQCDKKTQSDLNIDGKVDEQDLNILYAGFAKRVGD